MKKLFLFLFASLLSISMFAQGETGKTKAQAISYNWGTGIYVSSEAGVGKWYVVNLLKTMTPAGPFNPNGMTDDLKSDISITIVNPLDQEVDINCVAFIGDNETSRHFKMAAGGQKSMTFGAGMFVRMGINEVYLYLVTDATVTEEEAQAKEAVNVDVQAVESNSVSFVPVDFDWTGFGLNTPAAGNEIAKNTETWLKIDWGTKVPDGYTLKLYAQNLGSAATTVYGGLATDCPATNIQEQTKDVAAGAPVVKVLDPAMLDMMPGTIYIRLKADQKLHVWAEQVAPIVPATPLFIADDAIEVSKNVVYNIASDSVVYKAGYAQLVPGDYGDKTKFYAVEVVITNNGSEDAVVTGKVAKNVSGPVNSAVNRTYTVKAGKSITKKLDKTLLSNIEDGDEAFALVLKGSNVSFLLHDVCLEDNPCVPAEAIGMTIPAAGSSVSKNQAAGTKWYAVDITNAKAIEGTDIKLTMTASESVDLTVDLAADCAVGEPTQSYTGSSASTEKILSHSLFKNSGNVIYVRVKTNKAITVSAELIPLDTKIIYKNGAWTNTDGPTKNDTAYIEDALDVANKFEAKALYIKEGGSVTIKNGGKMFIGEDGVNNYTANGIVVEDGGMLLIDPNCSNIYNRKPLVEAYKTLHLGEQTAYTSYIDDDHRATLPDLHEFIALPVSGSTRFDNVRYMRWDLYNAWQAQNDKYETFTGYNLYRKSGDTGYEFGDVTARFEGQLADNTPQSFQALQWGWYAFGNSWLAPIKLTYLYEALSQATGDDSREKAVHIYVPSPTVIDEVPIKDNYYVVMTPEIASIMGKTVINPMEGFFIYAGEGHSMSINVAYSKIWNDATTVSSPAPKRTVVEDRNEVAVVLRGGGTNDFVYMIEGQATNATKMLSSIAIYAEDRLGQVANDNLIGTTLSIKTNNATEYTLSFAWLKGETMYLKDLVNGNIIAMTKDTKYTFNAEPNTTAERFQVVGRNNETTGMENSAVINGVNKRIENGNVVIIKNGVKYNVLGAQL